MHDVVETHLPALKAMGNQVFHMGPLGSASIIKVITNMLAFIHLKACGEALMLAKRGGLDLGQAWHAIKASSGTSFVHETEGALVLNGSYDIAFNIDLALKDLGFAMEFGREFQVPLDLASMTEQTYVAARAAYGGDAQSPSLPVRGYALGHYESPAADRVQVARARAQLAQARGASGSGYPGRLSGVEECGLITPCGSCIVRHWHCARK